VTRKRRNRTHPTQFPRRLRRTSILQWGRYIPAVTSCCAWFRRESILSCSNHPLVLFAPVDRRFAEQGDVGVRLSGPFSFYLEGC